MLRQPLPVLLVSALAFLAPWAAPTASGDPADAPWPEFRGTEGAGRAVGVLPPGEGPLAFRLAWSAELGSGYSGVAVAADVVVTAAQDGDVDRVVALDRATGAPRWTAVLGPAYAGHDGSHDGPIATPAIAGEHVVALGPRGDLAAFALADGAERWRRHLVEELGCEKPWYGFGGSPRAVGDAVVLQIGGEAGAVAAFETATGELRWRAVEDEVYAQSPLRTVLDGREQVVVIGAAQVVGLDPADGAVLWSFDHGGSARATGAPTSSPLALGGDRLFVKHDGTASAVLSVDADADPPTVAVHADTKGMGNSYSPPALWEDTVYGFTARFLSAVDAGSGEVLWRSREPGDGFLVTADGHLLVLTKEGSLHLGPASREGWTETARIELFDDLAWTPPAVAGSSVFVRSLGGIARVDLVRTEAPVELPTIEVPAQLLALVEALETAEEPGAAVDAFLEGRRPPLVDGEDVVFLWRGEAADVAIAGHMIGMRREEPMHRLEGTDLWWWATTLDRRARTSYVFLVDDEPALDPAHRLQTPSSILGPDMNWQRKPLQMSWFAMPEWPGRERLEDLEVEIEVPGREEGTTESRTLRARVWTPPGYAAGEDRYPVVYVHRDDALEAGGWADTLDRVVGRTVVPLIAVFVEEPGIWAYHLVFASQVVPAVDARFRTRADRSGRANVSMGFEGAFTAAMTVAAAETFGALAVQSPFGLEGEIARLRESLAAAGAPGERPPLRVYLEWGRWDLISPHEEMDFRESGATTWSLFREAAYEPLGGEVWDSTDWASWSERTDLLLEVLFPLDGGMQAPAGLAAWTTADD